MQAVNIKIRNEWKYAITLYVTQIFKTICEYYFELDFFNVKVRKWRAEAEPLQKFGWAKKTGSATSGVWLWPTLCLGHVSCATHHNRSARHYGNLWKTHILLFSIFTYVINHIKYCTRFFVPFFVPCEEQIVFYSILMEFSMLMGHQAKDIVSRIQIPVTFNGGWGLCFNN